MTITSRIPPREIVGFLAVGFFGVVADVGTFNLGIAWGFRPAIASLFGFFLGATVSFLGNHLFTFADRHVEHAGKAYVVFVGINVIAVSAVQVVVWIGETMDASVLALNVMRLAAIAVVTVGRFVAYRTWVFRLPGRSVRTAAPWSHRTKSRLEISTGPDVAAAAEEYRQIFNWIGPHESRQMAWPGEIYYKVAGPSATLETPTQSEPESLPDS